MLKRYFLIIVSIILLQGNALGCNQGGRRNFDPKKFEACMEQFIVTDAGLTPLEASKFFPIYREMQKKMRNLFDEMHRYHYVDINDNRASENAVHRMDNIDIELKQIQQKYHNLFMHVLPAGKVYKIIKAEDKFHKRAFRKMLMNNGKKKNK